MQNECIDHGKKGNKHGYANCTVRGKRTMLHRKIYCEHNGIPIENLTSKEVIRHTCDNTRCINPFHLIIGTQADNMKDKVSRDRQSKGEDHYATTLTEDQVRSILTSPKSNKELADEFGVSYGTIKDIKLKKRWKHIEETVVYNKEPKCGERNGNSTLTEKEVLEIFKSSLSQRKLAKIYGVGQTTIGRIKKGETWAYLTVDLSKNK